MRLKPEQLAGALQKGLAPVYLVSGDEPLQIGELSDAIRNAAKRAGFLERDIFSAESHFNWSDINYAAASLSIFGNRRIVDVRVPSANFGTEGAKALMTYCEHLPSDTLLLITCGKLNKSSLNTRWYERIDKVGVTLQVKPLEGDDLARWLTERLHARAMQTDQEGLQLLCTRIEGNLLAGAQEIEKLYVLHGAGTISAAQISDAVADSSRYDVFKLVDALLSANVNRIFKILAGLQAEGVAAPVVLWALMREARTLTKIKLALASGQSKDAVFRHHQIWDKRIALVDRAIKRLSHDQLFSILHLSAQADRQAKGQETGDVWETIWAICLRFSGQGAATF